MSSKKLQISKNTAQTAKRLLKYVTETYKLRFFWYLSVSLSVQEQAFPYLCR